jgi:hypothetical protein
MKITVSINELGRQAQRMLIDDGPGNKTPVQKVNVSTYFGMDIWTKLKQRVDK